ncbi:MAG: DUF6273 domain-containing protein [Defluviitaleaceae bacterium]|nr:DUF6273 domain-containing protein [Defluviitaleaceae bacterium]
MKTVNLCNYEWYVLEKQDDKALLLAKDIITRKAYHEIRELTSWEDCTLRQWLNGEFYRNLEKYHANILETETESGVMDKIFLLSIEETKKYNIPLAEGWWWLRLPGFINGYAAGVCGDGGIFIYGIDVNDAFGGVRPAMWMDVKIINSIKSAEDRNKLYMRIMRLFGKVSLYGRRNAF